MDLFFYIIYEKIFVELFLENEELFFCLNAVVTIDTPYIEVLGKDLREGVVENGEVLGDFVDISLICSGVFLYPENLEARSSLVSFFDFLDKIEHGDSGLLFFIDTADNLTSLYVLVLWYRRDS